MAMGQLTNNTNLKISIIIMTELPTSKNLSFLFFDSDQLTDDDSDKEIDNGEVLNQSDEYHDGNFFPVKLTAQNRRGSNLIISLDFLKSAKRKRKATRIAKHMKRVAESGTKGRHKFLVDIALQSKRKAELSSPPATSSDSRERRNLNTGSWSTSRRPEIKPLLKTVRSAEVASSPADKSGVVHSTSLPLKVGARSGSRIPDARSDKEMEEPSKISTLSRKNAERRKLLALEDSLE